MDIPQIYTVANKTLYAINKMMNLPNRSTSQENARQIEDELRTNYNYSGEYDTRYIREFLKVWNLNVDNDLDAIYQYNLLVGLVVDSDNGRAYAIDKKKYNQLRNPRYLQVIRQQAQDELDAQQPQQTEDNFDELIDSQPAKQNNEQNNFLTNKAMAEQELEQFPRVTFANARNTGLNRLRRQSTARIENINPVNLEELRDNIRQCQRQVNPNLHPRTKKNKYGDSGMEELIRTVVNLKNDVKQIREAQSVDSANDWITTHGYGGLYMAQEEDLDNDGYPEVVVKDRSTGRNVIVNGYTTVPSLFPYRKQYYSTHSTKESRKNHPWQSYIKNEFYQPVYDNTGRNITAYSEEATQFDNNIGQYGYTKRMKPKNRSSYQAFTARCITPFYKALTYLTFRNVPFKLAQLSAYIWKEIVRNPALSHVYGAGVLEQVTDPKELTKLCSQPDIKNAIERIVAPYLQNPEEMFNDILPIVIDKWRENGYTMDGNQVRDFILASHAYVQGVPLPVRNQFEAWKTQQLTEHPELEQLVQGIAAMHNE